MAIRNVKYLPETPSNPEGYRTYRGQVLIHRVRVEKESIWSEEVRAREIVRCASDPVYFMATYGTIYEARPKGDEEDRPGVGFVPFVPYPFQIEAIDWFEQRMRAKGRLADGLVVKSRDMGLSNIAVFWLAWRWLFTEPFQARLLSRKEDLVDAKGDPDSLMWKLDTFLRGLPDWLFKAGTGGGKEQFEWRKHRTKLRLRNPRNGNAIQGESTQQNAGRGGRASVVILDEAAFIPNLGRIWTGLRASTNHRIAISTVSLEQGHDFYNLHHGKEGYEKPSILEVPWNAHPYHNGQWLADQMKRDTSEGVRREILMDYFAGESNWCYPMAQKIVPMPVDHEPYAGPLFVGIDDGFDNEGAAVLVQYRLREGRFSVITAVIEPNKTADWWGSVLSGVLRSDHEYSEEAKHFARMMRSLPGVTFLGDTHTTHRNSVTGTSFQEHLARNWNIHVLSTPGPSGQWTKKERIDKLSLYLGQIDWNSVPSVEYVLEAVKRNRFKKRRDGHQESSEARSDIHDWTSHPVSALEWIFVNFYDFRTVYTGQTIRWSGPDNG
jgi:hypothetical protein